MKDCDRNKKGNSESIQKRKAEKHFFQLLGFLQEFATAKLADWAAELAWRRVRMESPSGSFHLARAPPQTLLWHWKFFLTFAQSCFTSVVGQHGVVAIHTCGSFLRAACGACRVSVNLLSHHQRGVEFAGRDAGVDFLALCHAGLVLWRTCCGRSLSLLYGASQHSWLELAFLRLLQVPRRGNWLPC